MSKINTNNKNYPLFKSVNFYSNKDEDELYLNIIVDRELTNNNIYDLI